MNNARELQALYRETVLEHSRNPRNFQRLTPADRVVVGHNPLCGDKITLYLRLDNNRIENLAFEGTGCAISMASASIMTESVKHHDLDEAQHEIARIMHQFDSTNPDDATVEGDMAALGGVRAFPSRIKCATLAWKTLEAALQENTQTTTTEK
ncbi:MAG: SUF system NifU family Fe-S cluster assembly protein [Gammaproteobacteria bacterium]|jgi:nitrogen fixation NifU-like protein|nr:SUF system NifU family Fe-S cluster assembly protein [Chromatiales bacterium]MDP6416065.1 SUF system NifU family Fe-S cluster assembly protein [Gammaproteobacteria bacterium]MDP6674059.1 SUF system NifU family Fe-S cluster assembly protein [Gammaproteobacteria bacterium]